MWLYDIIFIRLKNLFSEGLMSYEKTIINNIKDSIERHQFLLEEALEMVSYHQSQIVVLKNNLNYLNIEKEKANDIGAIRKAAIAAIEKFELRYGEINYEENYLVGSYE